jgi:hypothetical protein
MIKTGFCILRQGQFRYSTHLGTDAIKNVKGSSLSKGVKSGLRS